MLHFKVNPLEISALDGASAEACALYFRSIRPKMDPKTGLIGSEKRRICMRGFAEEMYKEPGRGKRNAGAPTRYKVRRWLQELQRCGLISIIKDGYYLIIQCLIADYTFKNSQSPGNTQILIKETGTSFKQNTSSIRTIQEPLQKGLPGILSVAEFTLEEAKVTHPYNKENNNNNNKNNLFADSKFTYLPDDFAPEQATIHRAFELGYRHSQQAVKDFIVYHQKHQNRYEDWQQSYLNWLRIRKTQRADNKPLKLTVKPVFSKRENKTTPLRHSQEFVTSAVNAMPFYQSGAKKDPAITALDSCLEKIIEQENAFKAMSKIQQGEALARIGFKHVAAKIASGARHESR